MTTKKTTSSRFTIFASINVDAQIYVEAKDFVEAAEVAKNLKVTDFIKPIGELTDFNPIDVISITKN